MERKREKFKMVNVSEALEIDNILEHSGFNNSAQRTIIAADGFKGYDYILALGDSDIVNLYKGFSESTLVSGGVSFVLCRTNILKETIHWTQDFKRISRIPSLISISNAAEFCTAIEAARQRSRISK